MDMRGIFWTLLQGSLLLMTGATNAGSVVLPVDWPLAASARYRVEWRRDSDPGSALAQQSANDLLRGEVELSVSAVAADHTEVQWRPLLEDGWKIAFDASDMLVAGTHLWRHLHALPLTYGLVNTPDGTFAELRNAASLQPVLRDEVNRVLAQLEQDWTCTADATDALCARVGSADAVAQSLALVAMPFFNCVGMQIDPTQPTRWRAPYTAGGVEYQSDFVAEVREFDATADNVHIHIVETRDGAALLDGIERMADQMDAATLTALRENFAQVRIRFETECRMDRATGWPISVRYEALMDSPAGGGSERVQFERIETADALDMKPADKKNPPDGGSKGEEKR
jgi:hypothetical protein